MNGSSFFPFLGANNDDDDDELVVFAVVKRDDDDAPRKIRDSFAPLPR